MAVFKLTVTNITWEVYFGDMNADATSLISVGTSIFVGGSKAFGSIVNSVIVSLNKTTGFMNWAF